MLHDNWPDYTMSCGAVFRFRGKLIRSVLQDSIRLAAQRHPLTEANITRMPQPGLQATGERIAWVPCRQPLHLQWLGEAPATAFHESRPFDLTQENGVRIWGQQRGDRCAVFVEFHHACCDGHGGLSFMEDVLHFYDQLTKTGRSDTSQFPPISLELLKQRSQTAHIRKYDSIRANLASRWQWVRDLVDASRPIAPVATAGKPPAKQAHGLPRYYSAEIHSSGLRQLRAKAIRHGGRMNDLMVSRLFTSIANWNEQNDVDSRHWLRITIPADLRNRKALQTPMANCLSYHLIDLPQTNCKSDRATFQQVGRLMQISRERNRPQQLLHKFRLLQQLGAWNLYFNGTTCRSTAVLSNLGDPTRRFRHRFPREGGQIKIGNMSLTGFEGTTSLRPNTRLGIFFNTYGEKMVIQSRMDPRYFDELQATRFLQSYLNHLEVDSSLTEQSYRRAA